MARTAQTARDDDFAAVDDFDGARESGSPQDRQRAVRKAASGFHEKMISEGSVVYYRSFPLIRVPYPAKYAFLNAFRHGVFDAVKTPSPLVHICNRLFVIQYRSDAGIKTLLAGPSDIHANGETPFFKRLAASMGPLRELGEKFLAPELNTVEACLTECGIRPQQVDYISYDHLHTQDLRRWLGTDRKAPYFPRAKLLVMGAEWDAVQGLLPPQRDWYCPNGCDGVPGERVLRLDGSVKLGEGVALMHTPGHTEGNHSFVVRTPEGVMVTSENGVGPDAYSPENSKIPGLRRYAADTGMEVVLNGNTLERGLDQYISMIQEKTVAGRSLRNPEFYNVVCSSELAGYWGFPGVKPTFSFGDLEFGRPHKE